MKLFTCLASITLSLTVVGCKDNSTAEKTPGEKAGDAVQTAVNVTTREAKEAKDAVVAAASPSGSSDNSGMLGALEGVVQNALDKDDFKSLTGHLVDADQKRMEAVSTDNTPTLNADIEKFKEAWRSKYGGDAFGVMNGEKIFASDFVALQSSSASGAGDAKSKSGTATIAASHGMPEVKVPMVAQDGKWRLDLPDQLDAAQLRQNLQKAVAELNASSAQWPADKVQAYRQVSHRVLMAVTGSQAK